MDNAFYFGYYTQLANLLLKIREMQKNMVNLICMNLLRSFHFLSKHGYLIEERFDGEYECIVDALMLNNIYGIPYNRMKDNGKESTFTGHAWKLIYGVLSDKGKSEVSIN